MYSPICTRSKSLCTRSKQHHLTTKKIGGHILHYDTEEEAVVHMMEEEMLKEGNLVILLPVLLQPSKRVKDQDHRI